MKTKVSPIKEDKIANNQIFYMRSTLYVKLILSLCLPYSALRAQTQHHYLLQTIANEACECLEAVDLNLSLETPDQVMENCIKSAILQHSSEFLQNNINNQATSEQIGGEIATILFQECPKFLDLSRKLAENDRAKTSQGTFIELNVNELAYFILDDAGQTDAYVWLDPFPGWEKFTGDTRYYAGKTMVIQWKSMQVYNPQEKSYQAVKKILGIEVIE